MFWDKGLKQRVVEYGKDKTFKYVRTEGKVLQWLAECQASKMSSFLCVNVSHRAASTTPIVASAFTGSGDLFAYATSYDWSKVQSAFLESVAFISLVAGHGTAGHGTACQPGGLGFSRWKWRVCPHDPFFLKSRAFPCGTFAFPPAPSPTPAQTGPRVLQEGGSERHLRAQHCAG